MSWPNTLQKVVLELIKFISRNGHFFHSLEFLHDSTFSKTTSSFASIRTKYLKYQTTKYSKETLINAPAATEKCSLKIAVPKF